MTTATTPRQPAKRAKGRAHPSREYGIPTGRVLAWYLPADEYDKAVERMAREMQLQDWKRGYSVSSVPSRDHWRKVARAALKSIGIAAPRKERKLP